MQTILIWIPVAKCKKPDLDQETPSNENNEGPVACWWQTGLVLPIFGHAPSAAVITPRHCICKNSAAIIQDQLIENTVVDGVLISLWMA